MSAPHTRAAPHPVRIVGVPVRRNLRVMRLVEDAETGHRALREAVLACRDLRLADRRVVIGAWDEIEAVLYVWEPHLQLYGPVMLEGLAMELALGGAPDPGRAHSKAPPRIMLVEDDQLLTRVVQRVLEAEGFVVITTDSPFEFRPMLRRERPQLVLVDVNLPAISGDALVQVTRHEDPDSCPMVLFSSAPDDVLERLVHSSGAAGYIRKTGDLSDLASQARAFIEAAAQ